MRTLVGFIARRRSALVAAGAVVLLAAGGLAWREARESARLVRVMADTIPADPALMRLGIRRGASVFAGQCASCHGKDGHGDRLRGVPDLGDNDYLYGQGSPSDIEQVIAYGIRSHHPKGWALADMPAFAALQSGKRQTEPLSPAQISDVSEFVHALGGGPADLAAVSRGSAVYNGPGGCFDCHGADAAGDSSIGAPNLTDGIWLYGDGGREAIARSISVGRAGVMPAFKPRLRPVQIRAVALYVYSLSHPRPQQPAKAP